MSTPATIDLRPTAGTSNTKATEKGGIKIFLIGMMGSGKTYWADRLRKKFKLAAYDLDSLVEMMQEKTIAELFADEGEEFFRNEEGKMLRLFKEKKQFILSCGGGTPCYNENMEWMNKHGITIWLDEPVAVLAERLLKEKVHRPLINKLEDAMLEEYLQNKLNERCQFYQKAKHTLSGTQINEVNLVNLIKTYA